MEFNKRNFDKDNDRGFNRDRNHENRNSSGGGFRERSFGNDRNFGNNDRSGGYNRENRDGGSGGNFRERSFGGGGFNRDNRNSGGGGGFRKEFRRDERPPRPIHELVHSAKFRAGKRRTYFFDVRKTENGDHYITVTESTQRMNGGYDRHKVFLYKEDFNRFVREMSAVVEHIKTELQPEYDYDEFERRQLEWEEQRRLEIENGSNFPTESDDPERYVDDDDIDTIESRNEDEVEEDSMPTQEPPPTPRRHDEGIDDDMAW